MLITNKVDRTAVAIFKKGEEPSDVLYWLSRPAIERIATLEQIRLEYNTWKYGIEQGFQRVYRITEQK